MSRQTLVNVGVYSIAGHKARNDDACAVEIPVAPLLQSKGLIAVIADGMSGSEAGHEASQACVKGFISDYFSTPDSWSTKTSAHKVLAALNRWLHAQGQREYGSSKAFVSTLSLMILKSNTAYLFHVGDTRIYRLRGNDLELLTRDHRIQVGPDKSYLNRAMGIDINIDIDFRTVPVEVGDRFILLCDGVHEFLSDRDLLALLLDNMDDATIAKVIVEQALANGSNDNLSCVILSVTALPQQAEGEFYQRLLELPFPPPLNQGMLLDGYRILRQLHSTKRTEVYLALDTQHNREVIIKAPSVNFQDDPHYINQFLQEEWVGRRINSPHVLKICEQQRPRQFLYYVTEYIAGQSLRQWMTDHPRASLAQWRSIIEQISQGLRAFHRLEMIHQDLKPENIIIDTHGTVKIIDFGSVKIAGIAEITTPLAENNLLGTENYTAPEYHLGLPVSRRADLFSLGVIAYEMLTGRLPYDRTLTPRNLRLAHYHSARWVNPDIPVWLDRTLAKAVAINPDTRYERLSEFTFALSQPDPQLGTEIFVPLLQRNPLKSYKIISLILFLCNLVLLLMLIRH